jgi:hypothetical protein
MPDTLGGMTIVMILLLMTMGNLYAFNVRRPDIVKSEGAWRLTHLLLTLELEESHILRKAIKGELTILASILQIRKRYI